MWCIEIYRYTTFRNGKLQNSIIGFHKTFKTMKDEEEKSKTEKHQFFMMWSMTDIIAIFSRKK